MNAGLKTVSLVGADVANSLETPEIERSRCESSSTRYRACRKTASYKMPSLREKMRRPN